MKSRKGIRQIPVVGIGETPPLPQYGNIPHREVDCKSRPFLLHFLKLGKAKCIGLIICEVAQMKIYPACNCSLFCVACACLKSLVKNVTIWFDIEYHLYDLIAIVIVFNQWQLFREIEVAGILWRGQRTASCCFWLCVTIELER